MGGAIAEGNMTPAAEFNIWADPEAAQQVFHSGLDVTMIGLDVTHKALLTPAWAERFREAGRVGTFVAELVDFFKRYHTRTYGWDGAPIHDAVALAHVFPARDRRRPSDRNVEVELESELTPRPDRRRPLAPHRPGAERRRRRRHRRGGVPRAPARADRDPRVIVAAAIAPHGTPAFEPGPTRDALEEIGRRVAAADPETIVVVTPHNVHVSGHFAVIDAATVAGTLAEWGEADRALERLVDRDLAAALVAKAEVPIVSVSYGGNDPSAATAPMDWGTLIPLAFLPELPVVIVSPARDRALSEHEELGRAIAGAAADMRVALVASADHGHAHDPDGPYGFDPAAAAYDALTVELVRENRLAELGLLAELVERREGGQPLAAGRPPRGAGQGLRCRAAGLRGADVLRHALRCVCACRLSRSPSSSPLSARSRSASVPLRRSKATSGGSRSRSAAAGCSGGRCG